jgi:hypothetical protein
MFARCGVAKEVAGRAIHSPKELANKKSVAEMRIKTGNGSLAFFINPYLPANGNQSANGPVPYSSGEFSSPPT